MKSFSTLFLLSFLLLKLTSCSIAQKSQLNTDKEKLSIAIVPCEVVGLKHLPFDYSLSQQLAIQTSISSNLQSTVYHELADQLDAHYPTSLTLQSLSETNALLDIKGISLKESWELPTATLANLLNVDAVLRISIRDSPANVTRTSGTNDNPGAPQDDNNIWQDTGETFVSAGLFDGDSGIPLWSTGSPKQLGRKHEVIARRIARRINRFFP
ncbi:hypothetical protein [Lewinella cohaerens]|uniref:hypothetical protein n=1 Tax=Lewinella cohaerens TaxID=70995 RepID=UPI000366A476|nr:hypothetical protein [Lewinella cohaerens]